MSISGFNLSMGKKRPEYYHLYGKALYAKGSGKDDFAYYHLTQEMLAMTKRSCSILAFCLLKDNSHIIVKVIDNTPPDLSITILSGWNTGSCITNKKYLQSLIAYIHRLPVQHGISKNFQTYPYTSFTDILYNRKSIVRSSDVLKIYGSREIFLKAHREVLHGLFLEQPDCRI